MNYGIRPYGLGGDTMHMARLWDSSLGHDFEAGAKDEAADAVRGYSLTALSRRLLDRRDRSPPAAALVRAAQRSWLGRGP